MAIFCIRGGTPLHGRIALHGAKNAEFLHVFIGRYFRVDVVPLDHQREGHAQYEQPDGEYGAKQED